MKFDIITIFPDIFSAKGGPALGGDSCGYFSASIIKRAIKNKLIEISIYNLRDYTTDKHKKVDDTPYGGGAGMILQVEPIYNCVQSIINDQLSIFHPGGDQPLAGNKISKSKILKPKNTRVILFSAKGKRYTQKDAERLAKYENLILICGRYEGVDERVAEYIADEEISIGDFVLTGGEIPAMIAVDSVSRLLPGVLGNPRSLEEESFSERIENCKLKIENSNLEYSQYTKPQEFNKWKVPKVLMSGNHNEIKKWRKRK